MAVPKKKKSKAKRDTRRSHDRTKMPANVISCPQCQEPVLPYHVCPECGYYKGRSIVKIEESS